MLTGRQKAQLLIKVLGSKSASVLEKLSPEKATLLTSSIEDPPELPQEELQAFLGEVITQVKQKTGGNFELDEETDTEEEAIEEEISEEEIAEDGGFGSEEEEETGPKKRDPMDIAEVLSKERPQVVAFYLSKLEEEKREEIHDFLPGQVLADLETITVIDTPLSDEIFAKIDERISFEPEEEEDEGQSYEETAEVEPEESFDEPNEDTEAEDVSTETKAEDVETDETKEEEMAEKTA